MFVVHQCLLLLQGVAVVVIVADLLDVEDIIMIKFDSTLRLGRIFHLI